MLKSYYKNDYVTIYHGDCLEVIPQLEQTFNCVIADPPYRWKSGKRGNPVIPFENMWDVLDKKVYEEGAICVFSMEPFSSKLICSNVDNFKYKWYWKKQQAGNFQNAKFQPLNLIEEICVFSKNNCANSALNPMIYFPIKEDDKYPNTLLEFNKPHLQDAYHPLQKPVPLIEYLIETYTKRDDLVLDFCAGSGSTGIACINQHRKCILIDNDEACCEIAAKRIDNNFFQEELF
jgi:site-specific DNA-methyltransferase (adenine-specific)